MFSVVEKIVWNFDDKGIKRSLSINHVRILRGGGFNPYFLWFFEIPFFGN
jgi:hypothetical protein